MTGRHSTRFQESDEDSSKKRVSADGFKNSMDSHPASNDACNKGVRFSQADDSGAESSMHQTDAHRRKAWATGILRTHKSVRPKKHDLSFHSSRIPDHWREAFMAGQALYSQQLRTIKEQRQHRGSASGVQEVSPLEEQTSTSPTREDDLLPGSLNQDEQIAAEKQTLIGRAAGRSQLQDRVPSIQRLADREGSIQGLFKSESSRHDFYPAAKEERRERRRAVHLRLRQKFLRSPVLDPRKPSFMIWDAIITLGVLYTALIVPYELAFVNYTSLSHYMDSPFFWINRIVDVVYLIDILLGCITMYNDKAKNVWVMDPEKIFWKYFRTWMLPDLVTMIPFDVIMVAIGSTGGFDMQTIKLLRMMKLLRVWKGSQLYTRLEEDLALDYGLIELFKYLGALFLITHWLACVFGLLTQWSGSTADSVTINWAKVYFDHLYTDLRPYSEHDHANGPDVPTSTPLIHTDGAEAPESDILTSSEQWATCGDERHMSSPGCWDSWRMYVAALYWSAMTVTTIGYGDIVPTNALEQVVVIFAMLLGGIVFGYIVGVFAGLISNQDQQKKRYRDEMRDLNSLVKETRASKAQAKELRHFFKFLAVSRTMSMSAYQHLLQRMSPAMRGQVTRMTDNNWVERLPYFRNVPEAFVVELVQALGYQAYPAGEMLFKYGDENNQMYVVKQGVVYFGGRVVLPGSTFCEESLYKPGTQGRTAVAFTFTFLYTLKREALHHVVRGYPEVESQFRVKSIRRLFREEVCSYAYAVQALFDQSLFEAVEDTVSNAVESIPADMDKQLDRMGLHRSQLESLADDRQASNANMLLMSSMSSGKRKRMSRMTDTAAWTTEESNSNNGPYIHPLWSHLNAMRVQHYYEKLVMIVRISEDESSALDNSVLRIQRWVRGWLARRRVQQRKDEQVAKKRHKMLASVPDLLRGINQQLDAIRSSGPESGINSSPTDNSKMMPPRLPSMNYIPGQESESVLSRKHMKALEAKVEGLETRLERQNQMLGSIMQLLQDQRQQQAGGAPQLTTQQLQEQSQPPSSQENPSVNQAAEATAVDLSLEDETAASARDGSAE